ncbi:hypothetical protein Tco_0290861 [Tanacetum coccineum]
MAIKKKLKELIQKDELTIADLEGSGLEKLKQQYKNDVELEYHVDQLKAVVLTKVGWNSGEGDVSKPRSFERHMSKNTKHHPSFYNDEFYYLVNLSTEDKLIKVVHRYHIEALNGIHYWEDRRQDFLKAEINNISPRKVYSDKRIISVVRVMVKRKWGYGFLSLIIVKRSDKQEYIFSYAVLHRLNLNDIEDMHLLKVQDKMYHLPSDDKKDFNNALLLFIQRIMIHDSVEDLQLGMESYQRTLNLTKPKLYFEEIDEKIPYTMTGIEKGVVYLNQYNRRSLMKLSKVKKFCDGTLMKIRENLIDMVNTNELFEATKVLGIQKVSVTSNILVRSS